MGTEAGVYKAIFSIYITVILKVFSFIGTIIHQWFKPKNVGGHLWFSDWLQILQLVFCTLLLHSQNVHLSLIATASAHSLTLVQIITIAYHILSSIPPLCPLYNILPKEQSKNHIKNTLYHITSYFNILQWLPSIFRTKSKL